jgi:hypothetical protein
MMSNKPFPFDTDAMPGMRIASPDASLATRPNERARRFDAAMRLMEDGRWCQAFTRLAALADTGHPLAARIALLFVRRGALLFGGNFSASAQQRECWQRASE